MSSPLMLLSLSLLGLTLALPSPTRGGSEGTYRSMVLFKSSEAEHKVLEDLEVKKKISPELIYKFNETIIPLVGLNSNCDQDLEAFLMAQYPEEISMIEKNTRVKSHSSFHVQQNPDWGLRRISRRQRTDNGVIFPYHPLEGQGVDVFVLDSGIRITHKDFGNRARRWANMIDYWAFEGDEDLSGHGTAVASLVAGRTMGVAKRARIHDVKVLNRNGWTMTTDIILGIEAAEDYALKHPGTKCIVNLSLGADHTSQLLQETMAKHENAGLCMFVASAGNDNIDACSVWPASSPGVLTIGAMNQQDQRTSFSNWGRCVDLYAPGIDIRVADHRNNIGVVTMDGTSMGSPLVAGIAAMLWAANPSLTPREVRRDIIQHATRGPTTDVPWIAHTIRSIFTVPTTATRHSNLFVIRNRLGEFMYELRCWPNINVAATCSRRGSNLWGCGEATYVRYGQKDYRCSEQGRWVEQTHDSALVPTASFSERCFPDQGWRTDCCGRAERWKDPALWRTGFNMCHRQHLTLPSTPTFVEPTTQDRLQLTVGTTSLILWCFRGNQRNRQCWHFWGTEFDCGEETLLRHGQTLYECTMPSSTASIGRWTTRILYKEEVRHSRISGTCLPNGSGQCCPSPQTWSQPEGFTSFRTCHG